MRSCPRILQRVGDDMVEGENRIGPLIARNDLIDGVSVVERLVDRCNADNGKGIARLCLRAAQHERKTRECGKKSGHFQCTFLYFSEVCEEPS